MEYMKRRDKTVDMCELLYEAEHRQLGDGLGVVLIERFRDKATKELHHPFAPAYVVRDFCTLEVLEERYFVDGEEVENLRALMGKPLTTRQPS